MRVGSWMTKKNVLWNKRSSAHHKGFFLIISFVLRHSNGEIRLINSRQENRSENSPSDILSCRPTRLRSGSYRTCHEGLWVLKKGEKRGFKGLVRWVCIGTHGALIFFSPLWHRFRPYLRQPAGGEVLSTATSARDECLFDHLCFAAKFLSLF